MIFYAKKILFLILFCNNTRNFAIIVFERFIFIRKFSIHRSHFVYFFIQNEIFRFLLLFLYLTN